MLRGLHRRFGALLLGVRLFGRSLFRSPFSFLDQLLDLLPTFAADFLVEVRPTGRFDPIAPLFANLLVESAPPFCLDCRAALAADGFVKLAAPLVSNGLPALPTGFDHRHAPFVVRLSHWLSWANRTHSIPFETGVRSASMRARPILRQQSRRLAARLAGPGHCSVDVSWRRSCPVWFEDYNEFALHKGLKMKSPREFRSAMSNP